MNSYCGIECSECVVEKTVWRGQGGHGTFQCRVSSPSWPM